MSERASERMSAVERASKASSAEQANEWAVQVNERADEQMAQYPVIKSKCNECYFYYAACGGFVEMINHFLTQEIATIYN